MLFQSDYWLATGNHEKIETILAFLDTDAGIQTLVILDPQSKDDVKTMLDYAFLEDSLCDVTVFIDDVTHNYTSEKEDTCKKSIYVRRELDESTIALMKNLTPIFAIFV